MLSTCIQRYDWNAFVKYIAFNLYTLDMLLIMTRHIFAVSLLALTETHMFVSGHSVTTVAKVGAAGKLY